MITKEELLYCETFPDLHDISLSIYKDFSVNILFHRRFHYYFSDGTDIILEFREWGIYHMLAIQHINVRIDKNHFFNAIDGGLDLASFKTNNSIKNRYKKYKKRIQAFACLYNGLRRGMAFYLPSGAVNNGKIEINYIIFNMIGEKGLNIGLRKVGNVYIPITILLSRASDCRKYVNEADYKLVRKLEILDDSGTILEEYSYALRTM